MFSLDKTSQNQIEKDTVLGDLQCKLQHMNGRGNLRGYALEALMIFFLLYRTRLAKSAHGVAPLNLHPLRIGLQPILACALNRT
jgi:hypothetical protein